LLLQFGRLRAQAGEGFWMALEEPELHVPPPFQCRLVRRIQALSTQTFVSTHSAMVAAMADPTSVIVLRNEGGVMAATPLLPASLSAATSNGVRKLFQLHRVDTIAALMHDAILIPEGRIDYEWLKLLARAVDLNQGWIKANESRFSTYVGLIHTQDAAIQATVDALFPLHPRITVLVDGDPPGQECAAALTSATKRPAVIVRWPDGWTIEDVIGWILNADAGQALPAVTAKSGAKIIKLSDGRRLQLFTPMARSVGVWPIASTTPNEHWPSAHTQP
jgi:putative ATP-dependent endonuclease of the OLD family